MTTTPKTQARDALAQQEAIGRAVKRGYAQALREVAERLGLPVGTGGEDAIERIAVFAKAPKA